MNKLLFPYAIEKATYKIVSPTEVPNGKECNCICFNCNEDLIAINNPENKQRPHFRHDQNTNCDINFESYLHWLSKEIFKRIDTFYLPEMDIEGIKQKIETKLLPLFNNHKTPKQLREIIINDLIENISQIERINIQEISIEESFKTPNGFIRVDIVLRFKNKNNEERILFIEPYLSNKIDFNKLAKLREINVSTISINLQNFIAKKSHFFNISELRAFLVNNIDSKKWEYYSLEKLLNNKKIMSIENRLIANKNQLEEYSTKMKEIKDLYREIEVWENKQNEIKLKLSEFRNEVRLKYNQIDKIDFI